MDVDVVVVGAGMAGVACAAELAAAGVSVRVLERSRSVGGRMASRSIEGRPVDLGAAYFTAADPGFVAVVDRWCASGLARAWTSAPAVLGDGTRGSSTGPVRFAAPGGLRSLVADLAGGLDVELGHEVTRVEPGRGVTVLAMPDPQALRLLDPASPAAAQLAGREWRPVIAVAAGWARRGWPDLPFAFVNDHPVLSSIADDGDRRGDGAPVLVAHTTAEIAHAHDGAPDGAVPGVLDVLRELLGVTAPPLWTHAHRWRFASPATGREATFHLGADGIALAGDGWGRPRVEAAWRSGTDLARAILSGVRVTVAP